MTNDKGLSPPPYREGATGIQPVTATTSRETRYLYYRVYTLDGAIRPKTAFSADNSSLGHLMVRSIPPPHRVDTLRRCLVKAEDLGDQNCSLYLRADSPTPASDSTVLDFLGTNAENGTSPDTAFALVIHDDRFTGERPAVATLGGLRESKDNIDYLYYRLFARTEEDTSATTPDAEDPSLGRIDRNLICPPRDALSVKRCIAWVEEKMVYRDSELYAEISAQEAISDEDDISFAKIGKLGSFEKPIVLVQSEPVSKTSRSGPPLRLVLLTTDVDTGFGTVSSGQTFYTDAVVKNEWFPGRGTVAAYRCVINPTTLEEPSNQHYLPTANRSFAHSAVELGETEQSLTDLVSTNI
ncbi:hypothetical protein R3P38DRAFT_2873566 [Favolaschia claudopus]|uniref:Uncharacterized protein n=1 Tax=Favolaschia claudopus TaxID=2862362 RepID=A0AAW0D5U3_9AGAR